MNKINYYIFLICSFCIGCNKIVNSQCTGIHISNPSSLIPNPSFEERDCCPDDVTGTGFQMDCIHDHIQASGATIDYHVVDCGGSLDHPCLPYVPTGTLSDNGILGFVNTDGWKEYLGTCLTGPLNPGTGYTLKFKVGFGQTKGACTIDQQTSISESYSPLSLSIYGTGSCSSLPFPGSGCPPSEWILLGSVMVSGIDEWKEATISFEVTSPTNAIIFGPGCSSTFGLIGYYYLDDMILNETNAFNPQLLISSTGHPCSGMTLSVNNYPGFTYQWYYNNSSILGATSTSYQVPAGQEGGYFARMYYGNECVESDHITYQVPVLQKSVSEELCFGETVQIGSTIFETSGNYTINLTSINGCDSIVHLSLLIREKLVLSHVVEKEILCAGEVVQVEISSNAQAPAYHWGDGVIAVNRTLPAGIYSVQVEDNKRCISDANTFIISEPDSLKTDFVLTDETCVDYNDGTAFLLIEGGVPPYEYKFNSDDFLHYPDSLIFFNLPPQNYEVLVMDSNHCLINVVFSIFPRQPVNIWIEQIEANVAIGDSVTLSIKTDPKIEFGSYKWLGNQLSCDTCSMPSISPMSVPYNQYLVHLLEKVAGCPYSASLRIRTIDGVYIPNVFSPDDDGMNDTFFIQSNPNSVILIDEFYVYDRWGEMMFNKKYFLPNIENYGWDGTFKGKVMPSGAYIYFARIKLINGNETLKKGTVTILR